ncbi:MAG: hypothetical protein IT385_09615 [Deltaproteobacteria bacterium]|nr:hypothetical protein [Deltaproteobacteria bacterium]
MLLTTHLTRWPARWRMPLLVCAALASSSCGDSGNNDDDGADTTEEVWTAPPRKACSTDGDCADADACTWDERCEADGFCAFRILSCDDDNVCTSDTCDPTVGCLFEPFEGNCDDDNPCTLGDHCMDGACFPSEVKACDDDNPCTADSCDPETGACVFEPRSDLENSACDAVADACSTAGRCEAGRCVYEPVACPSDTQCRTWSCDPTEGCVSTDLVGACNDGDVCTLNDACAAGECVGGSARTCSDDDVCTDDRCDPLTGCFFPNNTAPCEDGIACTADDRCADGACTSGPADCDDDNPCTVDFCDGANGCKHFATASACDDGNPCTTGDHCEAGACIAGPPASCDDGKLCTTDVCTPNGEVAICSHPAVSGCLQSEVDGNYYGLFYFGFDELAGDPVDFDCLGTATASLIEPDVGPDVISGSASCTWDLSLNPNRSVLLAYTATDTNTEAFVDLGPVTVRVRVFEGTLTARGALVADLDLEIYVTTDFGNPKLLTYIEGSGTAPPANQPKAVSVGFDLDLSDFEVPLCCKDDGSCFPGGEDVCASVGATPVAPESSGECCIDTGAGISCVDAPAAWCNATPNTTYFGPAPSACCLASGCALLSESDCEASGGSYHEALTCADGDEDGFADVCPAPPGCAQPGVAICTLAGKVLSVAPTGFRPIPLRAEGSWTPAGTNTWTTNLPFWIDIDGTEVPVPLLPPGLITVTCDGRVSVTGSLDIPDLSAAGFEFAAPETESPTFEIGFGLGQDLDHLDAPLSDCRTYVFFDGNSRFTIGSGDDQSVLNEGSQVTVAIDPFDPAFYARAEGQILDGPTGGLLSRVGFGISRGGHLKWVSDFAVPPAPGRPAVGETIHGHVYATGEMGVIPIAGSPVQIVVDGESVYDLGPYPEAAEAILAGVLSGDLASVGETLTDLGTGLTSGQVLDELAYGVNAHEIRLEVEDFTFVLARGTLVMKDSAVRFAAEVGNLGTLFPDDVPSEIAAALDGFGVKQVYQATGVIDQSGFELRVVADLTFGPVVLEGAGFLIRYDDGDWTVEIDEPSISLDFMAWLESLKDFLGCDFTDNSASCSVGGVPVGKIAFDTSGGRMFVSMEATLPGSMGKVLFSANVTRNGDFVFTGQAKIPLSGVQTLDATLVLTEDGVRVIGTIADISTSMTFDGTIWFDGSFLLSGLGSMTLIQFIELSATGLVSYCPVGSKCADEGNVTGDFVMLIAGEVDTPVGEATLQGELVYEGSQITYDLQGMADFDVGGFAGLDGTMRVTNRGTPGGYLHVDLDLPLVAGQADGELFADGSFTFAGTGSLKIPGFTSLATATIEISSASGIRVASRLGVAGAQMQFSGRIGPDGFAFTGDNDLNLVGFGVKGNVTFVGSSSGASFTFSGSLWLGTTKVEVAGSVQSNGNFAFTGKASIKLWSYTLANAAVTFDNSGLSVAGDMNIANLATFRMSGRIESDLDFSLSAAAQAVTFPGGLSGELSAALTKDGNYVHVGGSGHANFFGARANGGFSIDTAGKFEFYGEVGFDWSGGNLSLEGQVKLRVSNGGFSASAHAEACADFLFDDGCAGVGGSINSSGEVCVKFPIAGSKCVDIL